MVSAKTFAARYDALLAEQRIRALYGDSGYFNVGYWSHGVRDLASACDRLVDEVASAVPRGAGVVLDVGCGLGAGTCRLVDHFPRARVTGVNVSHWQLTQARRRGLASTVASDAATLAIATTTVDAVLAIESAEHFDTREDFFREAYRVLRPGGVIALADMIFKKGDAIADWMLLPRKRVCTIGAYQEALRHAGFSGVTVRDVTAWSWTPFCREMRRVYGGQEDVVQRIEDSLAHYVLAFAHR